MTRTAPMSRVVIILGIVTALAGLFGSPVIADEPNPLDQIIARAQVWTRTNVAAMDLKTGPRGPGAFPFRATVTCDYVDEKLSGQSPKFACKAGDDELKIKYGGTNGEVYGEVLATRLLWALGFGADRMYPVNVICRGCPEELGGIERAGQVSRFDPAIVERKMPGKEYEFDDKPGWSWKDFARIAPARGGAPRAHRDALTLLAVFMQHSDSKPEQQRTLCLGPASNRKAAKDACARPFLMMQDVGLTFGRPTTANTNSASSVNLAAWRETPVWKAGEACIGNLPKSFSGTLDDPAISEEGRRFLANLLLALSDRQIRDLFEVARIELRLRKPSDTASGFASIDEWVEAFKAKRAEIVERRCATSSLTRSRS